MWAGDTGADAEDAFAACVVGLGIEGDAFEGFVAVVAGEAFWVEACSGCGNDAAGNGKGTGGAQCRTANRLS